MKMNLAIIGSTGFLGRQAIEVLKKLKNDFNIFALTCEKNINLLVKQAKEIKPRYLGIYDFNVYTYFKKNSFFKNSQVVWGEEGLLEIVSHPEVNGILFLASKTQGLNALILGIKKRKKIALASKELVVAFGSHIFDLANKYQTEIIPIDSEIVAIHSLLNKYCDSDFKKIYLTASGGSFFVSNKKPEEISVKEVLIHPVWKMGKKITVDSATMINKIFEIIETSYFFNLPLEKIDVFIHPQGIIHGLIENNNGIFYGMFAKPDMRIFISYALLRMINKNYDFLNTKIKDFPLNLQLIKPDRKKFPSLGLLRYLKKNTSAPAVLVGADEICVESFLEGEIRFSDIIKIIEKTLKVHKKIFNPTLLELIQTERWAKTYAKNLIRKLKLNKR